MLGKINQIFRGIGDFAIGIAKAGAYVGAASWGLFKGTPSSGGSKGIINHMIDGTYFDVPQNLLYDLREVYAGIDSNGNIQKEWLKSTYAPTAVGLVIAKAFSEFLDWVR